MRPSKRPTANLCVDEKLAWKDSLEVGGALPVPELAEIEVAWLSGEIRLRTHPTEKDVACGLHQPLALDHSLSVVGVWGFAQHGLKDRWPGFLALEKKRVGVVPTEHQDDPTARADAADPDDLPGQVNEAVALEQLSPVARKCPPITPDQVVDFIGDLPDITLAHELLDRHDERWVGDDAALSVNLVCQLGERLHAVLCLCLCGAASDPLRPFLVVMSPKRCLDLRRIEPG